MNEPKQLPPLIRTDRPRLIKDVLKSGRWYIGTDPSGKPQYVTFTDADLESIAQRLADHQAAGISHPLAWGHPAPGHDDVDPDKVVAPIEHVWAEAGVLWFGVYPTEEQAVELTGQHRQTSIGLLRNWRDGTGKVWPGWSMLHVGIVPHATVPDQMPFLNMAATTRPRAIQLAVSGQSGFRRTQTASEPSAWDVAIAKGLMRHRMKHITGRSRART